MDNSFNRLFLLYFALSFLSTPSVLAQRLQPAENGDLQVVKSSDVAPQAPSVPQKLDAQVSRSSDASGPGMTLPELQKIADQHNPTLEQAEAAIRAAKGRARQAGMLPNPVVGYQSEEFAFRSLSAKPEYFGFIEQTLPMGGKLKKTRVIYQKEALSAEIEAESQRQRVLNSLRAIFFEALGAQQEVDLNTQLAVIARAATSTTSELYNIGQADKPDYLESQIELEQVEHQLQVSKNNLRQLWKEMAALIGTPLAVSVRLQGSLQDQIPPFDEEQVLAKLMTKSPQLRIAQAQIDRAKAVIIRAKAEPIPDLFLRGGLGYSTEFLDNGGRTNNNAGPVRTGLEANLQIGATVPIWNRNQGSIAAAKAELAIAESENERLKLGLRVRFAQVSKDYYDSVDAVNRYQKVILASATNAYNMYLEKYKSMSASYPQVLIAQRTLFQAKRQYIRALVALRQNSTQLEGYLLTGGLDAPHARPDTTSARFELSGDMAAVRTGHDTALDTAGLVEY